MTFVRSNNVSLKYQRFTTLGSKDMGLENQSLWQRLNSFLEFQKFRGGYSWTLQKIPTFLRSGLGYLYVH